VIREQKLLESEILRLRERAAAFERSHSATTRSFGTQMGPSTLVPPPPALNTNLARTKESSTPSGRASATPRVGRSLSVLASPASSGRDSSLLSPSSTRASASGAMPWLGASDAYAQTPLWLLRNTEADTNTPLSPSFARTPRN
jgi:hypothetical protein